MQEHICSPAYVIEADIVGLPSSNWIRSFFEAVESRISRLNVISQFLTSLLSKVNLILAKSLTSERYNMWTLKPRLSVQTLFARFGKAKINYNVNNFQVLRLDELSWGV